MLRGIFRTKNLDDILASAHEEGHTLKRTLGPINITLLGIGAIIGAGIFATVGTAAAGDASRPGAGPSLMVSFVITAIVCAFTALCYAEMAAMVPISGSAYTYSYATLGELVAWIIGWDLMLEYAIGNVAVAISWANYFRSFMHDAFGVNIPDWLATDFRTARHIPGLLEHAPHIFGYPIVFNLLAFAIVAALTILLVWGIKESAGFNAIMVMVKIVVLLFFIGALFYFVSPSKMQTNWHPFQPMGWGGTLAGAAVVFFAYIGFDAVSTVAEETKNPARDLPIGIIASLVICTVFYVVVAAVFTGAMPYLELKTRLATEQAEPLTMALNYVAPQARWASALVAFGSVVAHTAVLLVFQLGQPRIFFSMARDGLLPPVFAKVHPRFKTPHVTTILTGVLVGGFAAVMSIDEMVDLTNIGTLFAFVLVCIGIIILRNKDPERRRPFKVPSQTWLWIFPILAAAGYFYYYYATSTLALSSAARRWHIVLQIILMAGAIFLAFIYPRTNMAKRVPVGALVLPLLGAVSCIFLMYYLPPTSWWRFVAWLLLGLAVYLSYSYSKSEIGKKIGRAPITAPWLMLMALGSFLLALGLLTIPHDASFKEIFAQLQGGFANAKQAFIGSILIVVGVLAAAIGAVIGLGQKKAS
ncbi:MAG TPA: amino acid permease [Pyrinomonadaceae bacterium]|nr:amino acid permease [Pyrinomonadaceae bacterium]